MFDHVGIAVTDLAASERFYRTVLAALGTEPSHADAELVEWEDWDIGPTDRAHPVTRGLHVGFRAPSRAAVDAFWQAGIDAGYRDDGVPGPRTATTMKHTAATAVRMRVTVSSVRIATTMKHAAASTLGATAPGFRMRGGIPTPARVVNLAVR
jgi:catechol 2,3-dioxygenase-like lactoylglutathione lyase family enzyme